MGKLKIQILDMIGWVALAVGVGMILWKVFGNSPTVAEVLVPFVVLGMVKVWSNNDKILNVGHRVDLLSVKMRNSFEKVGVDIKRMESKIDGLVKK